MTDPALASYQKQDSQQLLSQLQQQQTFQLPAAVLRGLNERSYDRRKAAALDVEKLVREALTSKDQVGRVQSIIYALVQELVCKDSSNARAGGLIALAATSIALGSVELATYLDSIVPHVLTCFGDQDARVRYYACEGMYNVAKVARGDILKYFNEIFDALSKLAADNDSSVKTGAELLDRLIKDVVSERSSYYPPQSELPDHPLSAVTDLSPGFSSGLSDLSAADRRFPNESYFPPAPGSVPLLPGMRPTTFNLARFIPLLAERLQTLNPSTRMFLVQWIMTLDSVPDLDLIPYLPDFMDALFVYLCDPNVDVRVAALNCLAEFLKELQDVVSIQRERGTLNVRGRRTVMVTSPTPTPRSPVPPALAGGSDGHESSGTDRSKLGASDVGGAESANQVDDADDAGSIVTNRAHSSLSMASSFYAQGGGIRPPATGRREGGANGDKAKSANAAVVAGQVTVLELGRMMDILLAHLDSADAETQSTALRWVDRFVDMFGAHALAFLPELVGAILPSLANAIDPIRGLAMEANANLFRLVSETPSAQPSVAAGGGANGVDRSDFALVVAAEAVEDIFDLKETVETLSELFKDENEETRVASMDWLIMLHKKSPTKVITSDENATHDLLKALSDSSEEVVRRDLQLLAQISHYSDEQYFMRFMVNLLSLFSSDRRLLETRGALIVRQLCLSLNAERIYRAFAEVLENDEDLEFASSMVQNLNIILITAPELTEVRRRLRTLESREGLVLFAVLYRSWCHNPVATFALCLLAQAYEHAAGLLQAFAELEVTVSFLVQVDKLVQLLESPAFAYLRLQLLEPDRYPHLFRCLFGVLMLLPQSSAFATLMNRLNSVGPMVMMYGAGGPLAHSATSQQAGGMSSSPLIASGRRSRSDKPGQGLEPITLRWHELLTHFRNVQMRHERSRRP
ncbi:hypothetical protein HK405_004647, partial [Cladochytrium tenue]